MKIKRTYDRKSGAETLIIKPGKRERFEYDQAEWLQQKPSDNFANFCYERNEDKVELYYDVTALATLKDYFLAPIGFDQYRDFLAAFSDVMTLCTLHNFPTAGIQYDEKHVFFQPDGLPRFVYVPISGVPERKNNTPTDLLTRISDTRKVSFVDPNNAKYAAALFDYINRNEVFSLAEFRRFLTQNFAIEFSHEGFSSADAIPQKTSPTALHEKQYRQATPITNAPQAKATLDPVAMLQNAPSANQIIASQPLSDRIKDGIGNISPTAAPKNTQTSNVVSAIDYKNLPENDEEGQDSNTSNEKRANGTTLLGGGVFSKAGSSVASSFAPKMNYLVRLSNGSRYLLDGHERLTIGRSTSNDIRIDGNSNISRSHISIKLSGDSFEVTDLGSSNGTIVKGRRLSNGQTTMVGLNEEFKLADETFKITH